MYDNCILNYINSTVIPEYIQINYMSMQLDGMIIKASGCCLWSWLFFTCTQCTKSYMSPIGLSDPDPAPPPPPGIALSSECHEYAIGRLVCKIFISVVGSGTGNWTNMGRSLIGFQMIKIFRTHCLSSRLNNNFSMPPPPPTVGSNPA
jgi:hypothetical protein